MAEYRLLSHKSRALGASSSLSCWSEEGLFSLNIVHGCPFECAYCRCRAASHLKSEYYEIYTSLHLQLGEELVALRKRRHPIRAVLVNTESDAFFRDPRAEHAATQCLEVLALHGVPVFLQTRGIMPDATLDVLQRSAPGTRVIFNIPSLSAEFQRVYEPRNPSLTERRRLLHALEKRRITVRGRIDPLLPQENDQEDAVASVLNEFARSGVAHVAVSYLVWSQPVAERLRERLDPTRTLLLNQWYRDTDGIVRPYLSRDYRLSRYRRMVEMAKERGITLHVCACKNTDLSRTVCLGSPPAAPLPTAPVRPQRTIL